MWRAAPQLGSLSVRSGVGVRSISSVTATKLFASLRAPIIAAPMFIVSNPDLVIAQCKVRAVACARPVHGLCSGLCMACAWHARGMRATRCCTCSMRICTCIHLCCPFLCMLRALVPYAHHACDRHACRRASSAPSRRSTRGPRSCSTSGSPRSRPISPSTPLHTPTSPRRRLR